MNLVVVLAGVAAVAAGIVWRAVTRSRADAALDAALADPDPVVRAAAVAVAASGGLARHAARLLALVEREQHPVVLDAVVTAVERNQWEPLDHQGLVALRLWAAQRRVVGRSAPGRARPTPVIDLRDPVVAAAEPVIDLRDHVVRAEPLPPPAWTPTVPGQR